MNPSSMTAPICRRITHIWASTAPDRTSIDPSTGRQHAWETGCIQIAPTRLCIQLQDAENWYGQDIALGTPLALNCHQDMAGAPRCASRRSFIPRAASSHSIAPVFLRRHAAQDHANARSSRLLPAERRRALLCNHLELLRRLGAGSMGSARAWRSNPTSTARRGQSSASPS